MSTVEISQIPTDAEVAKRRATVLGLMEAAARLSIRQGDEAAIHCRNCWREIARIETGCVWCEIGPNGVLAEAEKFLNGGQ